MERHGIGLTCPHCGGLTRVSSCRQMGDDFRRRRKCTKCGVLFTTWEFYVPDAQKHSQKLKRIARRIGKV